MIVQEPVQAAIWHCLNHYDYSDAVFLSERLYAEVKTDDSLFLLATAYYRSGQKDHAYHILKEKTDSSSQCRYLFGTCAYELEKYAEAEAVLFQKSSENQSLDDIPNEFGEQAAFALALLGKIAAKTERRSRAIDAWEKSLKLNPFLWSSYESLCKLGEKPNPQTIFQFNDAENLSMCQGSNYNNNIESLIIPNSTPNNNIDNNNPDNYVTPQQILTNFKTNLNGSNNKTCTPDESPLAQPLLLSGFAPFKKTRKIPWDGENDGSPQPSFGHFMDNTVDYLSTPNSLSSPKLTESNSHFHQSLVKRVKTQVDQLISRKEPILQNCKPVFSQSTNVPISKSPSIALNVQPNQNVRRSSRLFSNSYSVKENNKSPNRNKFATPKSPSRKTKQRITKCNLNKELNSRNSNNSNNNNNNKEKSETITSSENVKSDKNALVINQVDYLQQQVYLMQKQSAEGLMSLLRTLGEAYLDLCQFNCKQTIESLLNLPQNQFHTSWVYALLGVAYFEQSDYENSIKYFSNVHNTEPYRIEFMDIYSTALWHLQKEVQLSALAQDLVNLNKNHPITWCVSGNCFSLHKEHDTAIKFFQRAVQVDPNFPYAYTLLGHEYITTEELDKAMSCFRNAIRLDSHHYNAWFGIGTIYMKQERYQLAEINFKRALSINPQSSVLLCHIGVVQHALKDPEKALGTFNIAIANNPKSPLCKFHRGSVYFALGRHAEALEEFEELKEIVPKESLVYYLIGKVHKKLGNTDLALMHFSWATDLDPKGASSQIKEAFDPAIGRQSSMVAESPTSPTGDEVSASDSTSGTGDVSGVVVERAHVPNLNFDNLPEDSEDSF